MSPFNLCRYARARLDGALALSNSLARLAHQEDTPPHVAQSILDRTTLINNHLIDVHHAVVKIQKQHKNEKH